MATSSITFAESKSPCTAIKTKTNFVDARICHKFAKKTVVYPCVGGICEVENDLVKSYSKHRCNDGPSSPVAKLYPKEDPYFAIMRRSGLAPASSGTSKVTTVGEINVEVAIKKAGPSELVNQLEPIPENFKDSKPSNVVVQFPSQSESPKVTAKFGNSEYFKVESLDSINWPKCLQ